MLLYVLPTCGEYLGLLGCLNQIHHLSTKYKRNFHTIPVTCSSTHAIDVATKPFSPSTKYVFLDEGDVKAELRHMFKKVVSQISKDNAFSKPDR